MKLFSRKFLIYSGISAFLTLLACLYFLVLPKLINVEKYKPEIRKYLKENVSVPVELGKLDVETTWNLGIKIKTDTASIKRKDGSKFFDIKNSSVSISMIPLLYKKVVIHEIALNSPDGKITRLKDGSFDLLNAFINKKKGKYKVELRNASIMLDNYNIRLCDKYMSHEKKFVLKGTNIKISRFTPDKYIEAEGNGMISGFDRPGTFFNTFFSTELPLNTKHFTENKLRVRGDVINYNLEELKPYLNSVCPRKFSVLAGKGRVNFDIDLNTEIPHRRRFFIDSKTKDLNITDAVKGNILSHKGMLSFYTAGNFDDDDLYFNDFTVKGKNLNIFINGKVSNFARRKIRNSYLRIDIDNTRAKESAEIFPKCIKVPLDPFRKILRNNIDGNISGSITTRGYYKKPDLFGKIKFNDFSIAKKFPETPNGYGTVEFLGPTLVIDSRQFLDKNEFIETTGSVTPFKGKKIKLAINSTQNVDFARALPVLLAVRDVFEFKLRPVTDMDIKGHGKVNLEIEGGLKTPKLTGYVEAKNATVKYITLADNAENVTGKIKFTGDKVYYDELTGFVDGVKVIPSGYTKFLDAYSNVKLHMPELDLKTGQKFIYNSPLLVKVQVALKDIEDINGKTDAQIYLKGTEKNLESKGTLKFDKVHLKYRGYGEPFDDLKGQLRYTDTDLFFDNINGNVFGNNITLNGSTVVLAKTVDMSIMSNNIRLEDAKKFVMESPLLVKSQEILKDFAYVEGTSSIKLLLKGNVNDDCLKSLVFSNPNATFTHKYAGLPVKISQGSLNITSDTVQSQGIKANIADTDIMVKGKVSNLKANIKTKAPLIPDLELDIKRLKASNLKQVLKIPVIPQNTKKMLSKFSRSEGYADVVAYVKPSGYNASLDFDNFVMVYNPNNIPLEIEKGRATITDKNAFFSNVYGKISDSDFYLNGFVKNYNNKPSFEILSSLEFSSDDLSKLNSMFKQSFDNKGTIPVSASIKGSLDDWKVLAKMTLNKETSSAKIVTLNAEGKNDRLDINSLKLDMLGKGQESGPDTPWEFNVLGEKGNVLHLSGSIDKLASGKPLFKNFRINTNQGKSLSSCVLNTCLKPVINNGNEKFISDGNIQADLTLNGPVFSPDMQGFISFAGLKIPDYNLTVGNAGFIFDNNNVNLELKSLKIDDSSMNVKANLDYSQGIPFIVKDAVITSDYINIDKIGRVLVANKAAIPNNSEDMKMPYFVIEDGELDAKELILRDLITSNVKAGISFTPDWLLSVSDINLNAANGSGSGNLYYNTKSTELSFNLDAKNMQANALASTFMSMPNEVYGTLNGQSQFYTRGRNAEEMISNANGYAEFKINDGHLVRLGSIEYFLRAANVLQSGVGGLNFNNILDLVAPQKTGYFDHLEGKFDIKDGIVSTEEVTSSGKNLSLLIAGDFDMLTNDANVKILGKLSKKVSGMLGPLGSVSINQFIGYIPGFGFLPTMPEEKGIIDLVPGLSKIPVLGLDSKEKYRRFAVEIDGNLYDQKSVKSFKWLD